MSRVEHVYSHADAHIFITAVGAPAPGEGWDVLVSVQPSPRARALQRVALQRQGYRSASEAVSEALDAARSYLERDRERRAPI